MDGVALGPAVGSCVVGVADGGLVGLSDGCTDGGVLGDPVGRELSC